MKNKIISIKLSTLVVVLMEALFWGFSGKILIILTTIINSLHVSVTNI